MKMELIKQHAGVYGLNRCLNVLGVAKSTYYYQLRRDEPLSKYEHLRAVITKIIAENPAYGYRRIKHELLGLGIVLNHKPLRTLLKAWGLTLHRKIKRKVKSGIATILDELGERVNLLRGMGAPQLFEVVFSDITEIRYAYGKVYLGASLEAVSKRLIGSSVAKSPDSGLVVGVCRQALSVFEKDGH